MTNMTFLRKIPSKIISIGFALGVFLYIPVVQADYVRCPQTIKCPDGRVENCKMDEDGWEFEHHDSAVKAVCNSNMMFEFADAVLTNGRAECNLTPKLNSDQKMCDNYNVWVKRKNKDVTGIAILPGWRKDWGGDRCNAKGRNACVFTTGRPPKSQ